MERQELPRPTSYNDMYLYDICMSLRALVDAATPAALPHAPGLPMPDPTMFDLREPAATAPMPDPPAAPKRSKGAA